MADPETTPLQAPAAARNGTAPAPEQPPAPPEQPDAEPRYTEAHELALIRGTLEDIDMRLTTVQIGVGLVAGLVVLLAIAAEAINRRRAP
jgi:uncharacterized membrane protein